MKTLNLSPTQREVLAAAVAEGRDISTDDEFPPCLPGTARALERRGLVEVIFWQKTTGYWGVTGSGGYARSDETLTEFRLRVTDAGRAAVASQEVEG